MPFPWSNSPTSSTILVALSVLLMGVSSFRPQFFDTPRTQAVDLFAPFLSVVSFPFQNIAMFLHDITSLAQLQADNLRLSQENEKLREWYQTALLLDSENKSLRDLLNFDIDTQYESITARVISDIGNTYVKSLIIPIGRDRGIVKGSAVLSGGGLIGRIVDVGDNSSRILLVTDINSRVPVVVENSGQHAIMAGINQREPNLIHLPEGSEISNSARLLTSGYGGVYPHGIPVGKVVVSEKNIMNVSLYSNFSRIQIVRVLQKSGINE